MPRNKKVGNGIAKTFVIPAEVLVGLARIAASRAATRLASGVYDSYGWADVAREALAAKVKAESPETKLQPQPVDVRQQTIPGISKVKIQETAATQLAGLLSLDAGARKRAAQGKPAKKGRKTTTPAKKKAAKKKTAKKKTAKKKTAKKKAPRKAPKKKAPRKAPKKKTAAKKK